MKKINVKVTYTDDLVKKYMIDHFFIKSMVARFFVNIVAVIFLIIIFMDKKVGDLEFFILIIIIVVGIELNTSLLPRQSFKKIKKSDKILINSINDFTFTDNEIEIKTDNATNNVSYDKINNCFEVKNAYYIYLNYNQAFIINKSDIKEEDQAPLLELLQSKIKNYKTFNR